MGNHITAWTVNLKSVVYSSAMRIGQIIFAALLTALTAAVTAEADDDLTQTVSKAEQVLLGQSQNSGTVEERLNAIEIKLYGKVKKGPLVKRMQAVAEMLRIEPVSTAAPAASPGSQSTAASAASSQTPEPANPINEAESFSSDTSPPPAKFQTPAASSKDMSPTYQPYHSQTNKEAADLMYPNLKQSVGTAAKSDASTHGAKKTAVQHTASKAAKMPELKAQEATMAAPPVAPSFRQAGNQQTKTANNVPPTSGLTREEVAKNLLRQGLKLYSEGQKDQAETVFRRVLAIDPRNADAFYNLGSAAEARHDLVQALTEYRAALNLKPADKDFQAAVKAIEQELNSSTTNFKSMARSDVDQHPLEVPGSYFIAPSMVTDTAMTAPISSASSPLTDTAVGGLGSTAAPFQLQGSQNDALMYAQNPLAVPSLNLQQNPLDMPAMNVTTPLSTPTVNVAQNNPAVHKSQFSTIMNVGAGLVLRGSGLHCPICRLMSF